MPPRWLPGDIEWANLEQLHATAGRKASAEGAVILNDLHRNAPGSQKGNSGRGKHSCKRAARL